MKKILNIIMLLFLISFAVNVKAACNDKEVNELMDKFKIEVITDERLNSINDNLVDDEKINYILAFYPYSDKILIEVKDDSGEDYSTKYDDNLKTHFIGSKYHDVSKKYYIKAIASSTSSCENELLAEKTVTIPKFNEFSLSEYCDSNKNNELCSPLYDSKGKTNEELGKIVGADKENNKLNNEKNVLSFIKNNWYFIVIPILVISIIYIIVINNYKKKVSNL